MTDPLAKLFGSSARVKLLRLFLFNPRLSFTVAEATNRARVADDVARREVAQLLAAGVILRSGRSSGRYVLNNGFVYLDALQNLLLNTRVRGDEVPKYLRTTGQLKLIILSGIFVNEWDGHLDLLLVGERVNDRKLRDRMRTLEAELGRELRYTLLATQDFLYRLNMSDKLIRDVLDYPHRIVVDKLNIGLK